jgi:Fe-S-cluster-containing dehydrogenase component/anaerobic selenocysteine-containing dehydrogenase
VPDDEKLYQIAPRRPSAGLSLDRRSFIQLVGAGFAAGCAQDVPRQIVPYTRRPRDVVPGEPVFYATSMVLDGHATGLLVESREGRPVKIEANPEHPATLGGTTIFQQAAIRQLYDDDRARRVRRGGEVSSWEDLFAQLRAPRDDGGAGLRLLLPPTGSPLLLGLLAKVRARAPGARVTFHAPLETGHTAEGARLAFGRPLQPHYHLDQAQVIVALDADLLHGMPSSLRYARQWAGRRRLESAHGEMSRLYAVESLLTATGSMADHRLRRRSSQIADIARALAAELPALRSVVAPPSLEVGPATAFVQAMAEDLLARPPGTTIIAVGERQPPVVHALAHAMNEALGNSGATVTFTDPVVPVAAPWLDPLGTLTADMRAGRVQTLVMIDVNPVYDAPADLGFAAALARVPESVCVAYHEHETAERCRWSGALAHFLESWGDARAPDGSLSIVQPLIAPLVDARTSSEVLAALAGDRQPDDHRLLQESWRAQGHDEESWLELLRRGFAPGALPEVRPPLRRSELRDAVAQLPARPANALELELYPSPTLHDGRFANNPWLLEQPEPFTKITWDNAALVSPSTARKLGLQSEALVDLSANGVTTTAPVFVSPGLADGVVAVWLGYGRRGQERSAAGVGFDAYPWRTTGHPYVVPGLHLVRRKGRHRLPRTQLQMDTDGRPVALATSLAAYRANPSFTDEHKEALESILPEFPYQGLQWGMSIDLSVCTGCSACMVACQAENNVLVVGRENVLLRREMHWLRVDTYFEGAADSPAVVHQPMLCQHCEKAPCEYVCPVNATVHSADGLNEMVYNRCIGTRFCSNNCPYKVRRFNYFDYRERLAANRGSVELQFNPEVTVRERGVMEKCTYCVQRIRRTEIHARLEERPVRPGEVVTACQAACPTGAIQFGSLSHRDTPMVRWRQQDRSYAVLHDQGTQPRTMYLARIDNPNPGLK